MNSFCMQHTAASGIIRINPLNGGLNHQASSSSSSSRSSLSPPLPPSPPPPTLDEDIAQTILECLIVIQRTNSKVQAVDSAVTELHQKVNEIKTQLDQQQMQRMNLKSLNLEVIDTLVGSSEKNGTMSGFLKGWG